MKRFVSFFAILLLVYALPVHALEQDNDSNGLIDVTYGGLNALPTADTQLLQATGVGTFGWASVIDDAKGNGHTEYVWSADKSFDQLALKVNLTALDDTKGNGDTTYFYSADKVFDQLALKVNLTALDDSKGNGHTTFFWSADKSFDQLALKLDATVLDDTKGNGDATYVWSADKVFDQLALKVALTALDDTKGVGDTTYFWSADKSTSELALKIDATDLDDTKGNGDTTSIWSADKVFDQLALKAPAESPVFAVSAALPQGAAPTVDAAGEIAVDTTSDQLIYFGGAKRVVTYKKQKDFAIKAPADADDSFLFKAQTAITITDIHVIVEGAGTDISVDIQECDAAGANCATVDAAITADDNGAEDDGALTNGTIDAGDWVKVVLGAPTGVPTYFTGSIYYVETAD